MILLGVALFLLAVAIGLPIAFSLLLAAVPAFLSGEYLPVSIAVQKLVGVTQIYSLLAVPFFVFAGNIMAASGIATRLVNFSNVLVGWMAGGLAQVSIVLSLLMGGISGSAVADAAMQSRLLGPAMIDEGYSKGFAAGVVAYSSIITSTIPPSIGLIVFGFIANVSIGKLLLAGIVPGIILTAALMIYTFLAARHHGYAAARETLPTRHEVWTAFRSAFWALLFPVLLLVGFRFGFVTATEAGACAIFYSLFVGVAIHRELTWKTIGEVISKSLGDIGMIMLIIIMVAPLSHAIVLANAPQAIEGLFNAISAGPTATLLLVLAFLVLAGAFMEATVNVLLLTPLFMPILVAQGLDPVHFGVLMVVILTMGSNTPPFGVTMFTVCGMLKCGIWQYARESLPFLLVMLSVFLLLALVPELILWLPNSVIH